MRADPPSTRPNRSVVAADEWGEIHAAVAVRPGSTPRDLRPHRQATVLRDVNRGRVPWATCKLQEGLDADTMRQIDEFVTVGQRLDKGETLYHVGDRFTSLYVIRSGSCKTVSLSEDGHDQVSGYCMPGDIMGTDGIGTDRYGSQAVALEDTEVCALPFERLETLGRQNIGLQHGLHRLLSGEIARGRSVMLLLGTMHAEQRLAAFLLDLSQRYEARGYSSFEFVLRLTREEIGSYLGLKLETVSRAFSRFQSENVIAVQNKSIEIRDLDWLHALVGQCARH